MGMRGWLSVAAFLVAGASTAQQSYVDIVPASPAAFTPVHARIVADDCLAPRDARFAGGQIVVTIIARSACPSARPLVAKLITLGRLPPGEWTVAFRAADGSAIADLAPTVFTVPPSPRYYINAPTPNPIQTVDDLSGLWGIDGRAGSGVTLVTSPAGTLAGLIYIYEANGPVWYSIEIDAYTDVLTWTGKVYRHAAAGDLYAPNPSAMPTTTTVDSVRLEVLDTTHARLCLPEPQPGPVVGLLCYDLFRYPFH